MSKSSNARPKKKTQTESEGRSRIARTTLGPYFSEGSRQVWLILAERKCAIRALSEQLAFGNAVLNRHMYGDMRPDLASAFKYFDVLGIQPRLFLKKPRKSFRPASLRADLRAAPERPIMHRRALPTSVPTKRAAL